MNDDVDPQVDRFTRQHFYGSHLRADRNIIVGGDYHEARAPVRSSPGTSGQAWALSLGALNLTWIAVLVVTQLNHMDTTSWSVVAVGAALDVAATFLAAALRKNLAIFALAALTLTLAVLTVALVASTEDGKSKPLDVTSDVAVISPEELSPNSSAEAQLTVGDLQGRARVELLLDLRDANPTTGTCAANSSLQVVRSVPFVHVDYRTAGSSQMISVRPDVSSRIVLVWVGVTSERTDRNCPVVLSLRSATAMS